MKHGAMKHGVMKWAPLVWRIAREEWRLLLRNRVALAASLLAVALVLTATLVSHEQRRSLMQARDHYQAMVDEQFKTQPDRHPHRMVHYGQFVFRPLSSLAFFDFGVDSYTGNTLFLEGHRQNSANFADVRQSSLLMRFGQLSPAFVLQTLVPLLIVFLAFASVTRERERGNLRLLLSQGVSGAQLLFGKWIGHAGIALAVMSPVAVALIASAVFGASDSAAVAWTIAVYALYLTGWVTLSVLVSAWAQRGRDALLLLVGIWIGGVMLIPRTAPSLAQQQYPLPTRLETDIAIHHELATIGDSHNPDDPYFSAFRQKVLQRYNVSRIEDLPVNYAGLVTMEGERLTSALFDRYADRVFALESAQNRWVNGVAWLSPVIALRQLSMYLAGTDLGSHQNFLAQAESYRFRLIQDLNRMHAEEVEYEGDKDQRISHDNWTTLPRFSYRPIDPMKQSEKLIPPAAVLAFWLVALLALMSWRGNRLGRSAR
jgi:ABC-2 type transport system permease protein